METSPGCARGGQSWILGKAPPWKGLSSMEGAAQGSEGITCNVQKGVDVAPEGLVSGEHGSSG